MTRPWAIRKRERLDGLADLLIHARGATVLDLGCNRGLIGYEFAKEGARLVHGCDISMSGIATAIHLFADADCESRFEVIDLSNGPAVLDGYGPPYDLVFMLGVYHKLRRKMAPAELSALMRRAGELTKGHFAWNGFPDEYDQINTDMEMRGLRCVHRSELSGQPTAAWRRE